MKEYDLLAVWFRVADWAAYDLSKNGDEGIVLKPLGIHANAATFIARSAFTSSVYMHRKIGANLLGWIQQPPLSLLGELFQQEVERDSQLEQDDLKRLDSQSVVEDLVFSAAFWMRNIHSRTAAIEFLQTLVERTIAGEYLEYSKLRHDGALPVPNARVRRSVTPFSTVCSHGQRQTSLQAVTLSGKRIH